MSRILERKEMEKRGLLERPEYPILRSGIRGATQQKLLKFLGTVDQSRPPAQKGTKLQIVGAAHMGREEY